MGPPSDCFFVSAKDLLDKVKDRTYDWLNYAKNESVKLSDYALVHYSYEIHEQFYDKMINEM